MSLKLITGPADTPISLEEAKAHLREDSDDFNDEIEAFIEAATDYCDGPQGFLGRAIIDQTWELTLDSFPGCGWSRHGSTTAEIKIPMPPLIEIVSIRYDDADGVEQTLATTSYTVDARSEPGWVLPVGSWPTTFSGINAVRIRFRCGYLDQGASPPEENVPGSIKAAIKLIVGNLYANRETIVIGESVSEIPMSAEFLLRRKRFDLSMA